MSSRWRIAHKCRELTEDLVWECWLPLAEPPPSAFATFPSWPWQSIEVLERIEQPERFTTGAPLRDNETCDFGRPLSKVKMHELSASLAVAVDVTSTFIEWILMRPRNAVGTTVARIPFENLTGFLHEFLARSDNRRWWTP